MNSAFSRLVVEKIKTPLFCWGRTFFIEIPRRGFFFGVVRVKPPGGGAFFFSPPGGAPGIKKHPVFFCGRARVKPSPKRAPRKRVQKISPHKIFLSRFSRKNGPFPCGIFWPPALGRVPRVFPPGFLAGPQPFFPDFFMIGGPYSLLLICRQKGPSKFPLRRSTNFGRIPNFISHLPEPLFRAFRLISSSSLTADHRFAYLR